MILKDCPPDIDSFCDGFNWATYVTGELLAVMIVIVAALKIIKEA